MSGTPLRRAGRSRRARIAAVALLALTAAAPGPASTDEGHTLARRLMGESRRDRRQAARQVVARGAIGLAPSLVDALFFTPRERREELFTALEGLTGARPGRRYADWVEWVGSRQDVVPLPGYAAWKAELFARIDPRYRRVLAPEAPARIRREEIVSGGVPLGGIPALVDPPAVAAAAAAYLAEDELVFGAAVGGAARAYPRRIVSWHEMVEDTLGGEPVVLSYCTLCGSAVLFSRRAADGAVHRFTTSGLLYRSNKLMVDAATLTLWSNLGGEPVLGPLAAAPAPLVMLPLTLTTWGEWRREHPETTVLSLATGFGARFDYRPGAADRARAGVEFPVWLRDDRLAAKEEVYALRLDGAARAYPLAALRGRTPLHDRLGGRRLVLLADPAGGVRAYDAADRTFRLGAAPGELLDDRGESWRLTERALVGPADGGELRRLPGVVTFWFGWYAFHPDTDVWRPAER